MLSTSRAFIIHLDTDTKFADADVNGRVEHVASGRASRFASIETLLSFFEQTLLAGATTDPTP